MAGAEAQMQAPGTPKAASSATSAPALGLPGSFPEALIESQTSLNRAVWERRKEYTVPKTIRIKVGTWNVAAIQGTEKDVGGWFVHGKGVSEALSGLGVEESHEVESIVDQERRSTPTQSTLPKKDPGLLPKDKDIGLYVLGLQEIVDVASAVEAMRPYHDRGPSERWKSATLHALPKGYSLIAEQQLVGMYILIYAASDVAATISNVSCTAVGTGLLGYLGNKGAVSVRLVIGETTRIVFVNSHLSAGAEKTNMDRRNWDASQVVGKTRFDPLNHGHGVVDEVPEGIGDEDFCFWFGDLNYRLSSLPGHDIRRLLMLHTKEQYEKDQQKSKVEADNAIQQAEQTVQDDEQSITSEDFEIDPDQDPTSIQTTIASLLSHDELHDQIRKKIAFHEGWQEGKIKFMPTYKYDVGSVGMFDSSEKRRAPSWCDRILYRTRKNYEDYKKTVPSTSATQTTAIEKQNGPASSSQPSSAYDYDPDEDAEDPDHATVQAVTTKSGFEDAIELEYYTSHQRVLSSDHKPLDAVFQMTYQAVDPEKKAFVYQEVAKDFDREENESRPSLTVAVDTPEGKSSEELIDYGDIKFDVPISHTVTIANTGRNSASFGFTINRSWLQIHCDALTEASPSNSSSSEYCINPGDALTATIIIHVQNATDVRELNNSASTELEDVLVLRVSGGRDHFLTIRGRWLKSSFGMSMDELIRTPEGGARSLAGSLSGNGKEAGDVKWSAPRELFRLTEGLEAGLERAVAEWGMVTAGDKETSTAPWHAAGWPFVASTWVWKDGTRRDALRNVREALDNGQQLDPGMQLDCSQKVEIYAEALLQFLDRLQDGIVPEHLWTQIRDPVVDWEKAKNKKLDDDGKRVAILEIMSTSTPHNVSFTLILVLLKRMAAEIAATAGHEVAAAKDSSGGVSSDVKHEQEKRSEMQAAYIEVMQRVLFRPREDGATDKERKRNDVRRAGILELFLEEGIN